MLHNPRFHAAIVYHMETKHKFAAKKYGYSPRSVEFWLYGMVNLFLLGGEESEL